jgi:hypothetical protein
MGIPARGGHQWVEHHNCDHPGCMICEGGLALCERCGCLEGTIPTECPGEPVPSEKQDLIYAGKLDYRNGRWVEAPVEWIRQRNQLRKENP